MHSPYPSPSPPPPSLSFSLSRPHPIINTNVNTNMNMSKGPSSVSVSAALDTSSTGTDLHSPLPSPPLSLSTMSASRSRSASRSMSMPPPSLASASASASKPTSTPHASSNPSSLMPVPVCYRHRPDIQSNPFHQSWRPDLDSLLSALPQDQRLAVTSIWSTFAASSAPIRDLILLGLVDTCCMRQLTTLHRALEPAMKMDVLTQLPVELSLRVLGYLDARSLCRASQVSKAWARLANCDSVWHRLCLQHIDKKCVKCGWALPLLTKKRKRRCVSDPAADAARSALAAIAPPPPPPSSVPAILPSSSSSSSSSSVRPVVHCSGQMPVVTPPPSTSKPPCSSIPVSALLNPTTSSSRNGHATYDSTTSDSDDYLSEECDSDAARQTHSTQDAYRYRGRPGYRGGMTKRARLNPSGPASASVSTSSSSHSSIIDHLATSSPSTAHHPMSAPPARRSWKLIYAERLLIGRNWRTNTHAAYSLVPPTASLQPRVTACHLDEPYLMTSAMDGLVRLWHLETRTCLVTLSGHRGAVTSVHFDDAHGLAVSGGMDGTVRLWNWATGQCVRTLTGGHAVPVTALSFDQGILATADAASLIRVWDFAARTCFALCHGNQCAVTRVALCRGSLVSAGEDGVVRMWDLNTRSCTRTFAPRGADPVPGLAPAVTTMHVAQVHVTGGRHAVYVMAGMADGWAHVYVAVQPAAAVGPAPSLGEAVVAPLRSMNHGAPITSVWFDSLRVLTCGTDGQVHLWDLDTGDKIRSYSVGGSAGVVTGSDTRIVCAREDGVVHVWDFGSSKDNSKVSQ